MLPSDLVVPPSKGVDPALLACQLLVLSIGLSLVGFFLARLLARSRGQVPLVVRGAVRLACFPTIFLAQAIMFVGACMVGFLPSRKEEPQDVA